MKNYIYFILIFALLMSACRTDEFEETPGTELIPIDLPTYVVGTLTGMVIDDDLQAIVGATVELNGETTLSDDDGIFRFEEISARSTGSLVHIKKSGFFDGYKFTHFHPSNNSILKVGLVQKEVLTTSSSKEEIIVDVNGAELHLPANIAVLEDGTLYEGQVNILAHWYDPQDADIIESMPGDLRGIDASGTPVQLTTYGMMAVELRGDSGEELNLKPGMTARLSFPLPSSSVGSDQIPMWYLDEETGIWHEEGMALKQGSAMIAEVSHFSFWNVDQPFDFVQLSGRIVTGTDLIPVKGMEIVITDNSSMISGYGYTDNDGIFSGAVPAGNDLSMDVFSCEELVSFKDLGILDIDTDLGEIQVEVDNMINLNAMMLDCQGNPIDECLSIISTATTLDLVYADEGEVNHFFFPCNSGDGTLLGRNNTDGEVSDKQTFSLDNAEVDLGEVEVCQGTATQEVQFSQFGGETVTLDDAVVSLVDGEYIHIYGLLEGSFPRIYIEIFYNVDMVPLIENKGRLGMGAIGANGTWNGGTGSLTSNWSHTSGSVVGDIITGSYSNSSQTFQYTLEIDQIVQSTSISGNIWIDTNQNGIREMDENETVPSDNYLRPDDYVDFINGFTDHRFYYEEFILNGDGSYELKGLIPDVETFLTIDQPVLSDWNVSPFKAISDSSIDSDFFQNGFEYATENMIVPQEGIENIGLGLYK